MDPTITSSTRSSNISSKKDFTVTLVFRIFKKNQNERWKKQNKWEVVKKMIDTSSISMKKSKIPSRYDLLIF